MAVSFEPIGTFQGVFNGPAVLTNPTSLQFGPDGRLYVAEQNGTINAFTVALSNGQYVATSHELLTIGTGQTGPEVVKSIVNHNDNGAVAAVSDRQVTGLVVTTDAQGNVVLYVSSSDPRISVDTDANLDTNSGVITRLVQGPNGTWSAVDIVRGLPRSEENHSVNGLVLSPDGTKLYVAVGGNTNNGAPSSYFAYTAEYALSGTVLEVDLTAINARPVLVDPAGGQGGTSRQYVYDLPTLDDPNTPNVNGGGGENAAGLDEAGPWGGRDGLNMAILPADAPLRIYAHGFRNIYDLAFTPSGQLFTIDNGSNDALGGNPIIVGGSATNQPNNGGVGDPEPLYLVLPGVYYGHPNPTLSNQDMAFTAYNNAGTADTTLAVNTVADISARVPASLAIADGFLVDPSKFTANATLLQQTGIRVPASSPQSNAIVTLGSSTNGLTVYNGDAFGGALKGAIVTTQFNGNVTLLNINDAGTALEPVIDPGIDGQLGTTDDIVVDSDGIFPLAIGNDLPLDVVQGPNGTLWYVEFGGNTVNVIAPSDFVLPNDPDFDNDGLFNAVDPFLRDPTNGGAVLLFPGDTRVWDFDANQDGNRPGPSGYGGGLTGVMVDGTTDFEVFFQQPSTLPNQIIKLDNVKFTTAAGGGTTVVERVSNGNPLQTANSGEYLFHSGFKLAQGLDAFTAKWTIINPGSSLTGPSQALGGYLGTGDQSNYLKIAATKDTRGEIEITLENNDTIVAQSFLQADDLFNVAEADGKKIDFSLNINVAADTATPTVTYETATGTKTVSGTALSLTGSNVLKAMEGTYLVGASNTGVALGLFSTNTGQPAANSFQAIFDGMQISAAGSTQTTVLYRVNAGGPQVAAIDGGPDWLADTIGTPSAFLADPGSNSSAEFPAVNPGAAVTLTTPGAIFDDERYDIEGATEMRYSFAVPAAGTYEVRLFMGNGFTGTSGVGQRVFDVAIEGQVLPSLDNIDLVQRFGHNVGGQISNVVQVTDGNLDIEFRHGVENPLVNGIEILRIQGGSGLATLSIAPPNPSSVIENGDMGNTTLSFPVAFSQTPSAAVTVQYSTTVNGVTTSGLLKSLGTANGTIDVQVPNDNLANGTDTVSVTLTSITAGGAAAQIAAGAATATATVTEDDAPTDSEAIAILQGLTNVDSGASYAPGTIGSAVLTILDGVGDPATSNFELNSFQVTNTGAKQIAAVLIDFRTASFGDSVVDFDGSAGDTTTKPFAVDSQSGNGTGAFFDPAQTYLFRGAAPLPNTTGSGPASTGGDRGLLLKFDGTAGGFVNGETVGFSGDMDPNSIASLSKLVVDLGATNNWDVGGVSGNELIGSRFHVRFDDGSIATGYLHSDHSEAGSVGEAVQGRTPLQANLSVVTAPGGSPIVSGAAGTYGASEPVITVSGPAGAIVRVVLQKGFNPVTNNANGAADLIAARLAAAHPNFPVNNVFDTQSVDVVIGAGGTAVVPAGTFSYTSSSFPGASDVPLALTAAVVVAPRDNVPDVLAGNESVAAGPVSAPVYLVKSTGGANVPPTITSNGGGATATISVAENSTAVTTVIATDPNVPPQILSYALSGSDAALFQIASGVLTFQTPPDFESPGDAGANNVYNVTVTVSDGAGGSDTQALTINVTDVVENPGNVPPTITSNGGGASATIAVAENSTAVTTVTATDPNVPPQVLSYALSGVDAALFQIASGVLTFQTPPDFEAPGDAGANNVYNLTVTVSDGAGGSDAQALTINVTDVVENPGTGPFAFLLVDAAGADTVLDSNITAGETITLAAGQFNGSLSFGAALLPGQSVNGPVTITLDHLSTPGVDFSKVEVVAPYTLFGDSGGNYAVQSGGTTIGPGAYTLTATPAGGTAQSVSFTLAAAGTGNVPPTITSNGGGTTAAVTVLENTTSVTTVTATDPNVPPQTLAFALSGADSFHFLISPEGQLSFANPPDFESPTDAGANNIYDVVVAVSDGAGGTDTQALSITVADVNEGPGGGPMIFRLIDADTDSILDANLADGVAQLAANLFDGGLTLVAFAAPGQSVTGPVTLTLDRLGTPGVDFTRVESVAPYALFGDTGGTDYFGQNAPPFIEKDVAYVLTASGQGFTQSIEFVL